MARLKGTTASESLFGTATNDYIWGYAGNDIISAGAGVDWVDGGIGNDSINGGDGNDKVYGGTGNDTLSGGTGALSGNDGLYGGSGIDTLNGYDGNDYMDGGTEADTLNGGVGNDTMVGGSGNDVVNGDDGDDILIAGSGTGDDTYNGGANTAVTLDWTKGGYVGGDTLIYSGALSGVVVDLDVTASAGGAATGDTWSNVEHLVGSSKNDTLTASGAFNGQVRGGAGNDVINADSFDETMQGDAGYDILVGASGNLDYFVAQYDLGMDRFEDFGSGAVADKIVVSKAAFKLTGTPTAGGIALDASNLLVNADYTTASATTRLWFETDTKILWADLDGSGTAYSNVAIAVLDDVSSLANTDFIVMA